MSTYMVLSYWLGSQDAVYTCEVLTNIGKLGLTQTGFCSYLGLTLS